LCFVSLLLLNVDVVFAVGASTLVESVGDLVFVDVNVDVVDVVVVA
jgi:hypothetical protein